mgnify:CR=1 FL=1
MVEFEKSIASAKKAVEIELEALQGFAKNIETQIVPTLRLIANVKGRIVITGLGKSGIVGKKISATFASTGTPSFFIHSADALHGDSGAVHLDDLVIAISNSGETAEVLAIAEIVKGWGNKLIAITRNSNSNLARIADAVLELPFEREADPNGLAPTTSTTLTMVAGDALASAMITIKNFTIKDFGKRHPGGELGKKSNA